MLSKRIAYRLILALLLILSQGFVFGAATIVIVNGNAAGVGFNDPTPAAPVGGNPGTTLGEQRLNAFQAAADKWGATITSVPVIRVLATMEPLSCTSTSAVLGSAGPTEVWSFLSGVPLPNYWYHFALANKFAGVDLDPTTAQIRARFNSRLGQAGCLDSTFFYLGLDNIHGANIDLVTVLEHEFAHGLGFSTTTSGTTGNYLGGTPSAFDHFMYDSTAGLTWDAMTAAQRAASAINSGKLAWNGTQVMADAPTVLGLGTPLLKINSPAYVAGNYQVGTASFGPVLGSPGVTGEIAQVIDNIAGTGLVCGALSAANAAAVNGKIAMIDRGICGFTVKVKTLQLAGAKGVIIVDNVAGSPPPGLGGADTTITIPSVRVSLADGNTLKGATKIGARGHSGVFATLGVDSLLRAGMDSSGRVLMYTPNPFQSGSSVSHWDVSLFPNQLMEPAINGDLTHEVTPPWDLTFSLFLDIGW